MFLVLCSLLLAIFPLLPVIQGYTHLTTVYLSSLSTNVAYIYLVYKLEILKRSKMNTFLLFALNLLSFLNILMVRKSIESNEGLPKYCQLFSWILILLTFIVPVLSKALYKRRLILILFSLCNLYFHLSISYESAFVICLCLQMVAWLTIESFKYCGEFSIDLASNRKRTSMFVTSDDEEYENINWSNMYRVYLLVN
jgi:hypothetical protein